MPHLHLLSSLPGHGEAAWQATFNPTRSLLASCSSDKTVRLYSYTLPSSEDAQPVFSYQSTIQTAHKRTVRSIAWAPSGKTLATASFDSTVGVWEEVEEDDHDHDHDHDHEGVCRPRAGEGSKDWECVTTLEGHESECKSVGFSNDGALLASCSRDKSVWIWEVQPDADFECISVLMEHTQDVKCLAWHPHEEILASASYDSHIHLLFDDPDSDWCPFQKLQPHLPAAPLTIPSTSTALVGALMPTPKEKEANESLIIPPLVEDETVWTLAWSPCGKYLASGGDTGGIRIWTRGGHQPDSNFTETVHTSAHSRPCFSLSWAAGGADGGLGVLASTGGDGKIIIWQASIPEGEEGIQISPVAAVRDAHGESDVNCVAWCVREDGRGKGMLVSTGDDGGVKVWQFGAE
ncbi:cytosolic iron-sulfur protein assembly protein CIAO1, partial [Tremellales sp. Uapishka_1]